MSCTLTRSDRLHVGSQGHGVAAVVPTCFRRECVVCGRTLYVRVELLGQLVACSHCHATFVATDPAADPIARSD